MRMPQTECTLLRRSLRVRMLFVKPICSGRSRLKLNSVVSCSTQNRAVRCAEALRRRLKVAAQDIGFIDTFVREEPIRGLGVRPVLTRERQAFADRATDVRQ